MKFVRTTSSSAPPPSSQDIKVVLDSGAFSAFTMKKDIDVYEYIDFIKEHQRYIAHYIVLDVIGDFNASWKNQDIMEKAGLTPLPVYHVFGEPISYLHRCMEYPYFCVGSTGSRYNAMGMPSRLSHLDRVFSIVCDSEDDMPKRKVHALGVQSPRILWRYPFYSADASTWKQQSGFGHLFVPSGRNKDGSWLYDEEFRIISCSERVTAKCHKAVMECVRKGNYPTGSIPISGRNHIENQPRNRQKTIFEYVEEKGAKMGKSSFIVVDAKYECGNNEVVCWPSPRWSEKKAYEGRPRVVEVFEERGISNHYYSRLDMNLDFFLQVEKALPPWPWPYRKSWYKDSLGLIK